MQPPVLQPAHVAPPLPLLFCQMTMARLEADVPMEPDKLFKLLRTMDGKRIIDPFPREKHSQPVKVGQRLAPRRPRGP
jgi:hypothetical protein